MMRTRPPISSTSRMAVVIAAVFLLVGVGSAGAQDDRLITPVSVGPAIVGSTVEDLTDQLGDDYEVGGEVRITVDFSGHVVSRDGVVQFRAVRANAPAPELSLFIVNNQDFQTAEGVGPGTSIADAEAIYGEATLRWSPDDESREFVEFENQPEGSLFFRTPGIGGNNVGIYADGEMSTNEYDPDGMIAAIWVRCVPGTDCVDDRAGSDDLSGSEDPTPTPTPEPEPTPTAEPEPTPTAEPEPTPTPEPDPGDGEATDGGGDDDGALADTGEEHVVLAGVASTLFVLGGGLVLMHRNYLAPAWLRARS